MIARRGADVPVNEGRVGNGSRALLSSLRRNSGRVQNLDERQVPPFRCVCLWREIPARLLGPQAGQPYPFRWLLGVWKKEPCRGQTMATLTLLPWYCTWE